MNRTISNRMWTYCFPLVLMLSACSEPPTLELTTAEGAMDSATVAEAALYAADELEEAERALEAAKAEISTQANTGMFSRDYERSRQMLAEATANADAAATAARENRERMITEVETLLTETTAAIAETMIQLEEAPRGKDSEEDLAALRADLEALQASVETGRILAAAGNYVEAHRTLSDTSLRTAAISAELARATERVAGRAS